MESSLKITLFLSIAVLGVYHGVFAQFLTPTPPECCTRTEADANAASWDKCKNQGTFKSVSFCYTSTRGTNVSRYDYFTCTPSGSGFVLSKKNCPGPLVIIANGTYMDVFNRFDEGSKTCTLIPPTTTTMASTTASANATTTPSSNSSSTDPSASTTTGPTTTTATTTPTTVAPAKPQRFWF